MNDLALGQPAGEISEFSLWKKWKLTNGGST